MKYFSKINKISRQDNDDNMNLNEDSKQKSSITDRCVKLCVLAFQTIRFSNLHCLTVQSDPW